MNVYCQACGSRNIRPSYFRITDAGFLLTLRFPVRCRQCRKRFAVSIFKIRRLRREATARIAREEYYSKKSLEMLLDWQALDDPPLTRPHP